MSLDDRLLAVIDALYDAAMDEKRWPDALTQLTDVTASQGASFWVLDSSPQPRLPTFTTVNFDPAFIADYLDNMVPLDPTVRYLVAHPDEPIVHDGIVISERDKDHHPYYDWHGRHSETRFRLVGQARPAPTVQAGVALHRSRKLGRYDAQDLEQFKVLHGHLQRALAIGFRLGSLGTMQQCTIELLDRNSAAVLLLDSGKRVVYANRRAGTLHADNDGVRIDANGVVLLSKHDDQRLQRLIAQVLLPISTLGAVPGGMMRATRPSGMRPYAILVSPVPTRYSALSMLRPAVCLVITDPAAPCRLPIHRLQAAFSLTAAEARLAALLAAGQSLRSASNTLRITYGTARIRLAELFQKTETRRQGELISLLLTTLTAD